ncbi:MAG TPA: hypothetical protein DDX91_06405 [Ruminococcaceae bacterium]|nr:hypothetical protein [Oscillospiraceae bacterium]
MEEGDGEANYAYYALHKLNILPSAFLEMDMQEKAFVIAAIQIRVDEEKKEREKRKKESGRGK